MSDYSQNVSEDRFEEIVLQSKRPVLVDFWAEWCGPCRALAPTVDAIARRYAGRADVAKVNVDDNPSLTRRYAVQGIPTLILFKEGKEQKRMVGVASEEAISRMIDRYAGAAADEEAACTPDLRKVG